MKHYRFLNYLLCFLFLSQQFGCKKSDEILTKVFSQTELKTIEKVIKYYDDYVILQTDTQLSIDKAYNTFFDKKTS